MRLIQYAVLLFWLLGSNHCAVENLAGVLLPGSNHADCESSTETGSHSHGSPCSKLSAAVPANGVVFEARAQLPSDPILGFGLQLGSLLHQLDASAVDSRILLSSADEASAAFNPTPRLDSLTLAPLAPPAFSL